MFYNLIQGVKNLWYWLPIIWEDRDWDWLYILLLLRHKLQRMVRLFENDAISVGAPDIAEQIRTAVGFLDEIIDQDTLGKAFEEHAAKWGSGEIIQSPLGNGITSQYMGMKYPLAVTEDEQAQAEFEMDEVFNQSDAVQKDAFSGLFGLLHDKIQWWWE